jgi:hypothetical protein
MPKLVIFIHKCVMCAVPLLAHLKIFEISLNKTQQGNVLPSSEEEPSLIVTFDRKIFVSFVDYPCRGRFLIITFSKIGIPLKIGNREGC